MRVSEPVPVVFTFALEAQQAPDEVRAAVAEGRPGQRHPPQAVAREEVRGAREELRGPEVQLGHGGARRADRPGLTERQTAGDEASSW